MLAVSVDELTVLLLVAAVLLTVVIGLRTAVHGDAPAAKLAHQADVGRTRLHGESAVYRSRDVRGNQLTRTAYDDVKTLYDGFQRGLRISRDRPCLGTRTPGGPYTWKTYSEVQTLIDQFGSGLQALGVPPGQDSRVGIFSVNRLEWIVADQTCNAYSMVSVALYDTLGIPAVRHIIQQTKMPVVLASADKLETILAVAPDCSDLRLIVCMDPTPPAPAVDGAKKLGLQLLTFADVCNLYGQPNLKPHLPPKPDDTTTVCYTSGTTGTPKGVVLSHANLVANNAAVVKALPSVIMPTPDDVHLSYLPLAHMLERVVTTFVFSAGAQIGFYTGDVQNLFDDISALRPTYFFSVPRLWNRLYDRVQAGVAESSFVRRTLFHMAYQSKLKLLRQGIVRNNSFWDRLVFDKIRLRLGGRVKALITGAAPIAPEVMDFLRIVFGCQVLEGYGQSEASAVISITMPYDYTANHVGPPVGSVELKLVDVPEMDYFATDKPNPRGEICVRGPSVFKGYFLDPERTREALDADDWLHTGDVGCMMPNGTLRVIDRKKNIFKLSQGEYVAPEKIEAVCCGSRYVAQAWVYGDTLQSSLVAVIVPDADVVQGWAKENGKSSDLEQLCRDPTVKKVILDDIAKTARAKLLAAFEIPRAIHLEPKPFSVENDLLTPTFKLKRNEARTKYRDVVTQLYDSLAQAAKK